MTRLLNAAAVLAAVAILAVPTAARAADGSIPPEVREYVADGGLVARLADVYGLNDKGEGIDFDDTTTTGAIVRVHEWTAAQLAGEDTEQPIQLVNEWIVPISIAEEPAGLAIVWINPQTVLPELASFTADPDLAVALSEIPDTAALVHDETSSAWFALDDDGVLTPLVPGTTGLSTPVPLDDVALLPPPSAPPVASDPNTGLGLAIGVIGVLLVVIIVALLIPRRAERRDAPATADAAESDAGADESAAAGDAEPEPEPDPEPEPKPKPKRSRRPKAASEGSPAEG